MQQLPHLIECNPAANSAQIEIQPPALALNSEFLGQQMPLRQRGLRLHGSGRDGKRTKRSQLYWLRDFQTGKGRLAQAHLFARLESSDLRYVAVDAKAA